MTGATGVVYLVVWPSDEGPLDRLPLVLGLLHLEHEAVELLLQRLYVVVEGGVTRV